MLATAPPRWKPLAIGLGITLLGLAMTVGGSIQLASSEISPLLVAWISLPLIGLPLALWAGYGSYGLVTASYRLDREAIEIRWGSDREVLPLHQVEPMAAKHVADLPRPAGIRLPATLTGSGRGEGLLIEYFATDPAKLLAFRVGDRVVAFSPQDPQLFREALVEANRLGSLTKAEAISQRPDLLPARLWTDRPARLLLSLGLLVPLAHISYLGLRASSLPTTVPFGFTPTGAPGPPAPPGRLLLLPMIGGLVWLTDLLLGAWLYRRRQDRPLAYSLWALALVVNLLLWAAALRMIAA